MKKKIFIAIAAAILSITGNAVSAAPTETEKNTAKPEIQKAPAWLTRFGEAQEIARKEKNVIFVNFTGSDWCPWCVRLHDEVLKKPSFLDYAGKNLVLLMVDFPRRKSQTKEQQQANQALAEKYGIRGFPTILLLNPDGSVIARTGYRRGGADSYVQHLKKLLKK